MNDAAVMERLERVEQMLGELDDSAAELQVVQALVELYGEGLRRIVETSDEPERLADDELVSHLLVLHDLHPVPLEERIARALEDVRPYLGSHGGDVELVEVEDGVARLRLNGTCDGCPSSAVTLQHSIETAVLRAAPELDAVEAVGVESPSQPLLQIGRLAPGPCLPESAR